MANDETLPPVARGGIAAAMMLFASAGSSRSVPLIPNLQPLPAYAILPRDQFSGGTNLRFSTTSWNSGQGPLELRCGRHGTPRRDRTSTSASTTATVPIATTSRERSPFTPSTTTSTSTTTRSTSLQSATANGASDRTSSKTTFCVMDTNSSNLSLPGAPSQPVYTTCSATVQGMSVGWGDTYGRSLPGQGIDVTGLPEGDYRLVIEIDPKNRIIETNDDDNVACVLLHLNVPTSVTVLNANGCTSPATQCTVSSITPNSAPPGSTTRGVTITGSGLRLRDGRELRERIGPASERERGHGRECEHDQRDRDDQERRRERAIGSGTCASAPASSWTASPSRAERDLRARRRRARPRRRPPARGCPRAAS